MKPWIILAALLLFVSCSKEEVKEEINEIKIKIAKEAGSALQGGLVKVYTEAQLAPELNCEAEAVYYGEKLQGELEKFFNAKSTAQKSVLSASVAGTICELAVDKVLPLVLNETDVVKPCLKTVGIVKAQEIGKELCQKI